MLTTTKVKLLKSSYQSKLAIMEAPAPFDFNSRNVSKPVRVSVTPILKTQLSTHGYFKQVLLKLTFPLEFIQNEL